MGNDKNITLINENKIDEYNEIELLCAFEFNNNKYIVYSKKEHDFDGNMIVYSGKIVLENTKQYIVNVDNNEYIRIKDIIKNMIEYGDVSNV